MKSLIALLAFVSVPAFGQTFYTCTAANPTDHIQSLEFELGTTGPIEYLKVRAGNNVVSGVPTKFEAADGTKTYNLAMVRASYVITITSTETKIWVPANGNTMACHH